MGQSLSSLPLARSASLLHDPPLPPIVHLDPVAVSSSFSPSNLAEDLLTTNMPARNADQEKEILQWIEAVMGDPVPSGDFAEELKNGVVLCQLMNKISPGSVKKFKTSGPAFLLMENISLSDTQGLRSGQKCRPRIR